MSDLIYILQQEKTKFYALTYFLITLMAVFVRLPFYFIHLESSQKWKNDTHLLYLTNDHKVDVLLLT